MALLRLRPFVSTTTIKTATYVKLCDLTQAMILDFKAKLLKNISRALARKVITSLKDLLNEAVTQQKVAVNVASKVSIGKDKKDTLRATVPSLEHIRLILAELDKLSTQPNRQQAKAWRRYRALIAVAIHTGMRAWPNKQCRRWERRYPEG
ncbi:hypothetical protein [Rhizobium mongolense]